MKAFSESQWRLVGVIGLLLSVTSLPLYFFKSKHNEKDLFTAVQASYTGSISCKECHQAEFESWEGSHHDKAMEKATDTSVLGDFNNSEFIDEGKITLFYRKEDSFFVKTEGPDGSLQEFQITHVFGFKPLQQYLIPFPGGRLQCLNIAWDTLENKWYRLPPYDVQGPDDWLHWTKPGQNWNLMCADCHSTNLEKNYNVETDSYQTTWSEINVGCEACHGPASEHVNWANQLEMAREPLPNFGLEVVTRDLKSEEFVDSCARCHVRKSPLGTFDPNASHIMDQFIPEILSEGLYYPDGQILGEVYVYGSFLQSKMYHNGVSCRDCHDSHSLELVKPGNDLCLQCHKASDYNSENHHFHKREINGQPSAGWSCQKCHMPGRVYMGNDYRVDHSIRIPRPDLSKQIQVPNSCNSVNCHDDQTVDWALGHFQKWYGLKRKSHYGETIAGARAGRVDSFQNLVKLIDDPLYPDIVRSTAISLLVNYSDPIIPFVLKRALSSEVPLIRLNALRALESQPDYKIFKKDIIYLLDDEIKAVRTKAAMVLTYIESPDLISQSHTRLYNDVLNEYRATLEYQGDFPQGRMNLGNYFSNLKEYGQAVKHYRKATEIDGLFYPARNNLAMLYNQLGRNQESEVEFQAILKDYPEFHQTRYMLGLLQVEIGKPKKALINLKLAADNMPTHSRIQYNTALMLQNSGQIEESKHYFMRALQADPGNIDILYGLAGLLLRTQDFEAFARVVEQMTLKSPEHSLTKKLLPIKEKLGL